MKELIDSRMTRGIVTLPSKPFKVLSKFTIEYDDIWNCYFASYNPGGRFTVIDSDHNLTRIWLKLEKEKFIEFYDPNTQSKQ